MKFSIRATGVVLMALFAAGSALPASACDNRYTIDRCSKRYSHGLEREHRRYHEQLHDRYAASESRWRTSSGYRRTIEETLYTESDRFHRDLAAREASYSRGGYRGSDRYSSGGRYDRYERSSGYYGRGNGHGYGKSWKYKKEKKHSSSCGCGNKGHHDHDDHDDRYDRDDDHDHRGHRH